MHSFTWHRRVGRIPVLLLAVGLVLGAPGKPPKGDSGGASDPGSITYSGRAFAAFVNVPTLGVGPVVLSDTGQLPSSGGFQSNALLSVDLPPVLAADVLVASTSGANGVASSSASLAEVVVLPGHPAQITASFVRADSEVTCNDIRGSTEIVGLTFGASNIEITGAPNQTVSIPGVATLVINEQTSSSSGGSSAITVNALHLTLFTGDEVILSSAHSDLNGCPGCPPPPICDDFVTGGGWIKVSNDRANFGFNAGLKGSGTLSANFNFIDHGSGMHMKATSISSYGVGATSTSRRFTGSAEIDGVFGYTYTIEVTDNGEPGRNTDTLSISLSNGYSAGGTLQGGNIQLHKPCP